MVIFQEKRLMGTLADLVIAAKLVEISIEKGDAHEGGTYQS
jgi:hypothetical protein